MNEVEQYIKLIRDQHPYTVEVFTSGLCFQFYQILRDKFPDAEPWYDGRHVITRIQGAFYDITGEVEYSGELRMPDHYKQQFRQRHLNHGRSK